MVTSSNKNKTGTSSNSSSDLLGASGIADLSGFAYSSRTFNQPASGQLIGAMNISHVSSPTPYMVGFQPVSIGKYPNYVLFSIYWKGAQLCAWVNGADTGVNITPAVGDEMRMELKTDRVIFTQNGNKPWYEAAVTTSGSYFAAGLVSAGAIIQHAWIEGANLTGTPGGTIPQVVTYSSSTENAAWKPGLSLTPSGSSISGKVGTTAYTTRKFREYKLPTPGLRASIEATLSTSRGGYVIGLGKYSSYVRADGMVGPFGVSNTPGMLPIVDGQTIGVKACDDRVEWLYNGIVRDTVQVKETSALQPGVGFSADDAQANNVVLNGVGLIDA